MSPCMERTPEREGFSLLHPTSYVVHSIGANVLDLARSSRGCHCASLHSPLRRVVKAFHTKGAEAREAHAGTAHELTSRVGAAPH